MLDAPHLGERAAFKQTDVSRMDQAEELVTFAVDRFGGLDVRCNIAGVSGSLRRFLDDDLRDFERVVAVDLFGVMACSRAAALHMVDHGGGAIVNIASGAGVTPGVGMLPYRAFLGLEERSEPGNSDNAANSLSVYEFDDDAKLHRLDVYLQMEMPPRSP